MGTGYSWLALAMLLTLAAVWNDVEASALRRDADLTSSLAGCSDIGLCCQGKNNTCRVRQHHNRISDDDDDDDSLLVVARRNTCFCDSACVDLADCCHDYKRTCPRKLILGISFG